MTFLHETWYVAIWSQDLHPKKIIPRIILGEPIVLIRTEGGGVAALAGICPHRFAPLDQGKVLPGDVIRCPYHGLEFNMAGACTGNPHASGRIAAACRLKSYPAVEKHSAIWVWMGKGAADEAQIPDFSCLDADPTGLSSGRRDMIRVKANYRLVADNLMDLSHAPFLHEGVIGNTDTIRANIKLEETDSYVYVHRDKFNVRPAALLDRLYKGDGQPADIWSTVRWSAPANILNSNGCYPPGGDRNAGSGILGVHFLTPETETTSLYHFCFVLRGRTEGRNINLFELREWISDARRHAFQFEDAVIIERQQQIMLDYPSLTHRPMLFEIDAGPVRCNRRLDERIKGETVANELQKDG